MDKRLSLYFIHEELIGQQKFQGLKASDLKTRRSSLGETCQASIIPKEDQRVQQPKRYEHNNNQYEVTGTNISLA